MSVLVIMWAAKQTKKGVHKADIAIQRRGQLRMEKRMTKLGLDTNFTSSMPDLHEDPHEDHYEDPHLEDHGTDTWDPIHLSNNQILSNLSPEASQALAAFVATENESRKNYQVELRKSSHVPRDTDAKDFPADAKFVSENRNKPMTLPAKAYTPTNEKGYHRTSISDVREGAYGSDENGIQTLRPVKKARPGSRLLQRMSTWRSSRVVPLPLRAPRAAEAGF